MINPDLSNRTNRTKNQSNPIELQSFDWVRQSNKIEHLFCCEFDFRTNRTNIIEQNRTNSMQLSFDASNRVKNVEYNHCQLLLNKQELNIILQECQCSNKTKQIKGNFDDC